MLRVLQGPMRLSRSRLRTVCMGMMVVVIRFSSMPSDLKVLPRVFLAASAVCLMLAGASCTDDPPVLPHPPGDGEKITLTLANVGMKDVTLHVRYRDSISSWTLSLVRDGRTIRTVTVFAQDTLLTNGGLLPAHTYTFSVVRRVDTTVMERSNELRVTTVPPTSSAFQWRIDSLGGGTSSSLYDVAIIRTDPPLIYAVGELYLPGEIQRYNLAVWSGSTWSLKRIPYRYEGRDFYSPITTVLAFDSTDIWFAGNGVLHWDGSRYIPMPLPSDVWGAYQINKIWGSSSSNIYIVGNNGSIAHYNGSTWRRIESGTTLPIQGLYGAMKEDGSGYEILCVADSYMEPEGSKVIKIENDQATVVWNDHRDSGLDDIWFIPGKRYIVVGDGFWDTESLDKSFTENRDIAVLNSAYMHTIHGVNARDIVVAGSYTVLGHYNGYKWTSLYPWTNGAWGAKIKDDLIVAYGWIGRYALVAVGRR
ncbi:MAG: hypothetical protein HY962_03710 [Ignavibacteriae bacterium]|nr:hypothetical protein [Ignavibacteriota bacterium]